MISYANSIYALIVIISVILLIKVYDKYLKNTEFMKKILSIFKKAPKLGQLIYDIFLSVLPTGLAYSLIKIIMISLPVLIEKFYSTGFSVEDIEEAKKIIIEKIYLSIKDSEEQQYMIELINSLDSNFLFNLLSEFMFNNGFIYTIFQDLELKNENRLREISSIIKNDDKDLVFAKPLSKIPIMNKYSKFININF